MPSSRAFQSSGIICPVLAYQSQLAHSMGVNFRSMSKRRAAACSTRWPSGITSLPMPSPGMAAILSVLVMVDLSGGWGGQLNPPWQMYLVCR